jgi:hypothetical protein
VRRRRRKLVWEHALRLTLPWWPPLILWQGRRASSGILTPELLASMTVVLAGEYLLQPLDVAWRRLLLGLLPLVQGVLLLLSSVRIAHPLFLGWAIYTLASLGWALRAFAELAPSR